jgi:anti-anti-sigma factor
VEVLDERAAGLRVAAGFRVEVRRLARGGVAIAPAGELDGHTCGRLAEAFRRAALMPAGCIVLDLRRVELVDSTTLCLLLRAQRLLRADAREIAIVWGGRETRRPFELTGLEGSFRRADSYEELGFAT